MHSVTGDSPNDAGWDSDPEPGSPTTTSATASSSRSTSPASTPSSASSTRWCAGTVIVSATPGDPDAEPDPVPQSNVDLIAPHVDGVGLKRRSFGKGGTTLRYGIDERAGVDADFYRLVKRRRGHRRPHRRFAGWQHWHGSVGYNQIRIADRSRHFRPRPGRYRADLRFTDAANNTAPMRHLRFRIRG